MKLYSLGTREYDPFDQTIQVHAHAIQGNEIRGLFFPLTAKEPSLDCGDVLKNASKHVQRFTMEAIQIKGTSAVSTTIIIISELTPYYHVISINNITAP